MKHTLIFHILPLYLCVSLRVYKKLSSIRGPSDEVGMIGSLDEELVS